jgi:hypothetical protein
MVANLRPDKPALAAGGELLEERVALEGFEQFTDGASVAGARRPAFAQQFGPLF